ncbi:MAG: integrin alpha, partial [Limisphaerales bacterium]
MLFDRYRNKVSGVALCLALIFFFSLSYAQYGPIYQKAGSSSGDLLGFSVAGAGDVDGDGKADFIIGAFAADPGGRNAAGSAFVHSGATGSLLYEKNGAFAEDLLGVSVAGAGDVDGDGKADFIIGAPSNNIGTNVGSAFVYSGATGALLYSRSASFVRFGYSVAGAGDVNGDGKADFIVGAYNADPGGVTDAGSALVYSGATGSVLHQINGTVEFERAGYAVAGGGDVDGDGRDDFIVGSWGSEFASPPLVGKAIVYSGATGAVIHQKNGAVAGDDFGTQVA